MKTSRPAASDKTHQATHLHHEYHSRLPNESQRQCVHGATKVVVCDAAVMLFQGDLGKPPANQLFDDEISRFIDRQCWHENRNV